MSMKLNNFNNVPQKNECANSGFIDSIYSVGGFLLRGNSVYNQEEWKDVIGFEGHYQISPMGNVRSIARTIKGGRGEIRLSGGIMRPTNNGNGYLIARFRMSGVQINKYVHRLVALHYVPNPDNKPNVNHLDCNRMNNEATNLEWCTQQENVAYCKKLNRLHPPKGEKQRSAKLKETDIPKIRERLLKGETYRNIAKDYPVDERQIGFIARGQHWGWLK